MRDDDVAERSRRLVERGAIVDRERLGHVELDVVDELAVPDGLEEAVREPEGEDVLHRLLPEVVVDPKDLLLVEHRVNQGVQLPRALDVRAERLLDDHLRASGQLRLAETTDDVREDLGRNGAEDQPLGGAELTIGFLDRALDRRRGARSEPSADVDAPLREPVPALALGVRAPELRDGAPRDLAKLVVRELAARGCDQAPCLRKQPCDLEVVETGQELAPGEVARSSEEDDRRRADL